MIDAISQIYALFDEASGDLLVTVDAVDGFFVAPDEEPTTVVLLGARDVKRGWRRTDHAILEIVNHRREKIGEYVIGRIVLDGVAVEPPDSAGQSLACRFFGNRCEYPEAAAIWQRWASPAVLRKGEWVRTSASYQAAWLHVVQNSWFASNRWTLRGEADEDVHLDGSHITSRSGFFCALGEVINGPGGYFGSNLDALADCISSSSESGLPKRIFWQNYVSSQESLERGFLDSVAEILQEFDVELSVC